MGGVRDVAEPAPAAEPFLPAGSTESRDERRPVAPTPTQLPTPLDGALLDRIIHRVFTAGLLLNRAADGSSPTASAAIEDAIAELDGALRDIRAAAIFDLASTRSATRIPVPADLEVAAQSLDAVAAAITRFMAVQLLDGACTTELVDAAHNAHRARVAVEHARSAATSRTPT